MSAIYQFFKELFKNLAALLYQWGMPRTHEQRHDAHTHNAHASASLVASARAEECCQLNQD
jgi:hypothetical protein